MEATIRIDQACSAEYMDDCAGKFYIHRNPFEFLNAETLTFGHPMRHANRPDGHGTYFDAREEAEACLARYWEKQKESESQFLFTESNLAKCLMSDRDVLEFKQTAVLREFTDAISPFVIRVWVQESGRVLIDRFRCKTDTDNDGDCHLCVRSGGCSVIRKGQND